MSIDPGSSFTNALNLGNLSGNTTRRFSNFVGGNDLDDYFRFSLSRSSSFALTLSDLEGDADITLLDSSGQMLAASWNAGTETETISINNALAGTYYIWVNSYDGQATDYVLDFQGAGAAPFDPGSTLGSALDLGGYNYTLHTRTGTVNLGGDVVDLYRFQVNAASAVRLQLQDLTADVDLELLDSQGVVIANSALGGTQVEEIARSLAAGTYYARVSAYESGTINYTLNVGVALSDNAGNTLTTARSINAPTTTLLGTFTATDALSGFGVNGADTADYYRFTTLTHTNYSILLTGISSDVDLFLIQDINNNGVFDDGEIVASSILVGTNAESMSGVLDAGTYFILATPFSNAATGYTLTVTGSPQDEGGNSLTQARTIGTLSGDRSFTDFVGVSDINDYYRFNLNTNSNFRLDLTGLQADADVELLNGAGVVIASSTNVGTASEAIVGNLNAGTYYVRIYPYLGTADNPLNTNTNYQLTVSAVPTGDTVGNTLSTAFNVGTLSTTRTFTDFIGGSDGNDFYRFTLANQSTFSLSLTNLTADADVELIRDFNNNGIVDSGDVIAASISGGIDVEAIARVLSAGTYFVRVYPFSSSTAYTLTLTAAAVGDNTLATATNLGNLTTARTLNNAVGTSDPDDYYRFSLGSAMLLGLSLTGLSADADLELIRDFNNNGVVDSGDVIARSQLGGATAESLYADLIAGTYFVRVYQFNGDTPYTLNLTPVVDTAGSTLATARNLQTLATNLTLSEQIGGSDATDLYRFNVNGLGAVAITLRGETTGVTLQLVQDVNNNGIIEPIEILATGAPILDSFGSLSLVSSLAAGSYFIRVLSTRATTGTYDLNLTRRSGDAAGNTLATALNLGALTTPIVLDDSVSSTDLNDYYRFSMTTRQVVNLLVNELSTNGNLAVQLIQDSNGNNVIDPGEILVTSDRSRNNSESISRLLGPGTYYVRVVQMGGTTTAYTLNLATDPAGSRTNDHYGFGLVNAAAAVARAIGQPTPFANQPFFGDTNHWGVNMVNAPEVWARGYTGQGVTVAVLDTGVDYTHPDLDSRIWVNSREIPNNGRDDDGNGYVDDVIGWDFVGRDNNPQTPIPASPHPQEWISAGHGTHVAGTIAAERDGIGITGVAYNARIMPVRVADPWVMVSPGSYHQALADGIRYAVNNGARVLNLSLRTLSTQATSSSDVQIVREAVQYATARGAVVVVAAGNTSETQSTFPALYASLNSIPGVISVGAVDQTGRMAAFSNRAWGNQINYVVAPGQDVYSTMSTNGSWPYVVLDGTSMAAPHVAGVAALMLSANPNLTPAEVVSILTGTANPQVVTV